VTTPKCRSVALPIQLRPRISPSAVHSQKCPELPRDLTNRKPCRSTRTWHAIHLTIDMYLPPIGRGQQPASHNPIGVHRDHNSGTIHSDQELRLSLQSSGWFAQTYQRSSTLPLAFSALPFVLGRLSLRTKGLTVPFPNAIRAFRNSNCTSSLADRFLPSPMTAMLPRLGSPKRGGV
jgi:hypothetical protein